MNSSAHWQLLDAVFAPCQSDTWDPRIGCVQWQRPEVLSIIQSEGSSCGGPEASFNMSSSGAMSAFFTCAAREAQSSNPEGSPWRMFLAGDIAVLAPLLNETSALRDRVVTTPGAVGHTGKGRMCRYNQLSRRRECRFGADPGGAWTKSMMDMYLLGLCDTIFALGCRGSTFITVSNNRVPRDPHIKIARHSPVYLGSEHKWMYWHNWPDSENVYRLLQEDGLQYTLSALSSDTNLSSLPRVVSKSITGC